MSLREAPASSGDGIPKQIEAARIRAGKSRGQIAQSSGLGRRRLTAIERGVAPPSEAELAAIAVACGVQPDALVPPGRRFGDAGAATASAGVTEESGSQAIDALLREYLAMVIELRNADRVPAMALRDADLTELARALGGTPDAIETRLSELLGADERAASSLRAAILPSTHSQVGFPVGPDAP